MLDDDIAYFIAVADAGSMARAALRIGVTQPALSKAVQRLERKVGVPLLQRSAQGIELTVAGQSFLARSRSLASDLGDAVQEARDLGGGQAGMLRVGASPAASAFMHRTLMPQLLQERPAARLRCTAAFSDALLDMLVQRELDLALLPVPDDIDPGLDVCHLIDDGYSVIVNTEHPLAQREFIAIEDLAQCRWAASGKHEYARMQMERAFALHQLPLPQVVVEANNLQALLMAVSRLSLVSVVNTHSVTPETLPPNVRLLPLHSEHIRCPIGVVWRRGYLSPLAVRGLELLRAAAAP